MRPIPAPRLGDSHGLMRAIDGRERLRLEDFMTEFTAAELFPADLENALGRTRQFVSFARAAGLAKEEHGTVELTDVGRRYIRAGDASRPFDVAPGQAEWLRRQLREKHMTDSIYHGLAIALSLVASSPGAQVGMLDFGRALNHLGRAGWDNENTLAIQAERHLTLLGDMELVDGWALTAMGSEIKGELTLPVHMSLADLVAQMGAAAPEVAPPEPEPEPVREPEPAPPEPEPSPPREMLRAGATIRAAATERGLRLPDATYANLAAALATRHVLIVGPPASGKTDLALAAAPGAMLVAGGDEDAAVAAARAGRWLVIDDIAAQPAPSAFLGGHTVTIGGEEVTAPKTWRIVATARQPPEDLRGFAVIEIGDHTDLAAAIDRTAGDAVAAAAVRRLLAVRELAPLGAGVFLAAAAHAAVRRAEVSADDATLTREVFTAYVAPLLDDTTASRARELIG